VAILVEERRGAHLSPTHARGWIIVRDFASEVVRLVHVLERRLREATYLADEYSIADVGAFTWVIFAMPTRSSSRDASGASPAVDRWLVHVDIRPAFARGLRVPKIAVRRAKPIY
jgi:GST-like protein